MTEISRRWYNNCHHSNCHTICVFVDALALLVTYFISFLILANTACCTSTVHCALMIKSIRVTMNSVGSPGLAHRIFKTKSMFFLL